MRGKRKHIMIGIIIVILCIIIGIFAFLQFMKYQMKKIPAMTSNEIINYTTSGKENAVITVGIIKDGQVTYTVYGEDGKVLPDQLHTYEIGSLTKTFTAAMICKASEENKLDITQTIDKYLNLTSGNNYPTIEQLLTHTSGYKSYYFEKPMISTFLHGKNNFYGITKDMIINKISRLSVSDGEHGFKYSNFGYAVLGLVLEQVYGQSYKLLINEFLQNDLGLINTKISDKNGDLGKYWDWNDDDAYLSAGALTSNIEDMLLYAQMQLQQYKYFKNCHKSRKVINASTKEYRMMGVNIDEIGTAWIIDNDNNITWHSGGTGAYNCYLGFNPETDIAVVVLSNLAPNCRIPATVLGVKIMSELNKGVTR